MTDQKSIVLVTVDCLRADHAGFMGYERSTTPFLDSLSGESLVFPAAIVAGAPTYYSLPAIMASRYPLALGRDVLGLAPDEPTLASVLNRAGYTTACFGAGNPYISQRFGYDQGFDTFQDFLDDDSSPVPNETGNDVSGDGWAAQLNRRIQAVRPALGPLGVIYDELYFRYCQKVTPAANSLDALRRFPAADVIVDHACSWMKSAGDGPFFLWLHFMDPHFPYYPKEEALALMGHGPLTPSRARYLNSYWNRSDIGPSRLGSHRDDIVALYDAGIRWVDLQMARLIGMLRDWKRWDNCVFVLTADHGEEFLDHGGRYHPPSRLMEELIHVPLLLRVPGTAKKQLSKSPFSMVDLAPTLLDAVRLPVPSGFQGRSLWQEVQQGAHSDSIAVSESVEGCTNPFHAENRMGPRVLTVREERFKLALHFDPVGEELYDLESDPGEQAPLAPDAHKPERRRLLEIAREHLRCSSERHQETRLRARLRDIRLEWSRSFPQSSDKQASGSHPQST